MVAGARRCRARIVFAIGLKRHVRFGFLAKSGWSTKPTIARETRPRCGLDGRAAPSPETDAHSLGPRLAIRKRRLAALLPNQWSGAQHEQTGKLLGHSIYDPLERCLRPDPCWDWWNAFALTCRPQWSAQLGNAEPAASDLIGALSCTVSVLSFGKVWRRQTLPFRRRSHGTGSDPARGHSRGRHAS
jgi:hypothetical protein